MSWDIFVQDLPSGIRSIKEIPADFKPRPIGSRAEIIKKILEACPDADFSDPTWGVIEGSGYSIEVSIRAEEACMGFALHVRGGEVVTGVIAAILDRLDLRAIDPESDTGLFDCEAAEGSLRKWQAYRDQVVATANKRA